MNMFKSVFAERLSAYVKLRRGLGLRFNAQESLLREFDRYLCERKSERPLTQELALEFATSDPNLSQHHCARRYQVVRHFADYLVTFDPRTTLLDPKALRHPPARPVAHIYTDEELARLLHEARRISAKHRLRGVTLHAMIGLAASVGLRVSEVVRLNRADVDLASGVLRIRQSKFNKDRLLPVHPTTLEVLRDYTAARDSAFPSCDCTAFFLNLSGRRFAASTLRTTFWELTRRAKLRGISRTGPRFHDLRHRFAVRRLVAWYRAGMDVQALLPALATYMGHVHYSHTAHYLTATAEILGLAAERYHGGTERGEGAS